MNFQVKWWYVLNIILLNESECARILAVMPTPSYSHQIVFQPLWKELSLKGHHVTLLTTDPIKNHNLPNFRQIDWSFAYDMWHVKHNLSDMIQNYRDKKLATYLRYAEMITDIENEELNHPEILSLLNDKTERFDLIIVEFLNPTMLAFSEYYKCPYIGISPMDIPTFNHILIGNPHSPAIFSDPILGYYDDQMTFFERILNTFDTLGNTFYFHFLFYPNEDATAKKVFGQNLLPLKEIVKKVSMVFLNINPVLNDIRPLLPNVIPIGGGTHLRSIKKNMSQELLDFLNTGTNGVIYFSLGTNVKITNLPPEALSAIKLTFQNCPFRVVWKIDDQGQIKNSSNIFVQKWLPQEQILAHPNVVVFITQGGLQSLEEAVFNAVPIIGMPFFADQYANIRRLKRKGVAVQIDYADLTKESFQSAITEITSTNKYKNMANKLSRILKDQQISGTDQAVWWTEYVLRHKGAKLLKSDDFDIPYYQLLCLDALAFFIVLVVMLVLITYLFLKYIIYLLKEYRRKNVKKLE